VRNRRKTSPSLSVEGFLGSGFVCLALAASTTNKQRHGSIVDTLIQPLNQSYEFCTGLLSAMIFCFKVFYP
jgi:hypothetical protein